MNRVLVTGSDGQLGLTLQEMASRYPELKFYFLSKSTLDITQAGSVDRIFRETKPSYCINCAAYTHVDQAEKDPDMAFDVNVEGVRYLVEACSAHETVLIHISTDYVFDGTKEEGYSPSDEPNPINVYGRSKWEGEKVIQEHMERYFIVRTSWLYSVKYGDNFYKTILQKASKGETLRITDGQLGCPTRTETLGRFLLELIAEENTDYGIKHVTDGEAMTWHEFAKRILISNGFSTASILLKGEPSHTMARRPNISILKHR